MKRSFPCVPSELDSSVPTRFSFPQLLLVICYALIRSTLPRQSGEYRQIQDILRRGDTEWEPRVGSEGGLELQEQDWHRTKPETRRIWHKIHEQLAQQESSFSKVSTEHLRSELLHRIEQISAQCLNILDRPPPRLHSPDILLGGKARLILLGFSLAVTPFICGIESFASKLWDPDQDTLGVMLSQLNESPLFPNILSGRDLVAALNSLELIFSNEQAMSFTKIEVVRYETIEWSHGMFEVEDGFQTTRTDDFQMRWRRETLSSRRSAYSRRRKHGSPEPKRVKHH
ncbi:hypothetical protein N7478_010228 [Penicillium angulare]|uniref:uncharacterized protein n=1 Tax=Penicillium angulare TaxID=116970 RepID=UPI0025410A00|nr:uncharacterized protein N7478_010228 [Penicillium angulare]KAJ5267420.1 hypothetical protein N7478_010228 [Penicillium angulare]